MRAAPPVQPRYGPTLPDLLGRRFARVPVAVRLGVPAAILVAIVALLAYKVLKPAGGQHVVVHGKVTFNFRYGAPLRRVSPVGGELVRLEARRGDLFLYSASVRPLRLPPYRGQVSAALPAFAAQFEQTTLSRRFTDFQVVEEDRQRVVNEVAYAIFFTAHLKTADGVRHLNGRDVLLPEPTPGSRNGVELTFLSTPAGGAGGAQSVANSGALSTPFHTFRFGTSGG